MFERGFTIGRVRGIPIRIHISLLVFLPYVAVMAARQMGYVESSLGLPPGSFHLPRALWGLLLAVALFAAVVAHELAHSLVALRRGARVRSITLMMLGGVSIIEGELPPLEEAWMAFAGPLASFGIALVSWALYRLLPLPGEISAALFAFASTNAVLGVFNLLPAFPMDGGRVVRGLLAGRLGRDRATLVAARLGKGMAVLFALFALLTFNLILLFIAWFVYMGAGAEETRRGVLGALQGVPLTEVMSDRIGAARADETVGEVLRRVVRGGLVGAEVSNGVAHGIVTAEDLEGIAERGGAGEPVTTAMDPAPRLVHPGEDAAPALEALSTGQARAVVVVDAQDHVVGLVTPNELRRAAMLGRHARP
jgi:Zn-dependent protease/CBS domain-containing protein